MQTAKAYAKINLYLDTLSKGVNFTQIRTIFAQIDLHDIVSVKKNRSGKISFECSNKSLQNSDNLVVQVASYLKKKYKVKSGVAIALQKNIPIAAGLGGGSSDAAVALLALNKEWELDLPIAELEEIASLFGSDINFFLYGGVCLGEDRGQKVSKLTLPAINNILLVNPGVAISSREAYQNVKNFGRTIEFDQFMASVDTSLCYNGLEAGVVELYPAVGECLQDLQKKGAKKAILSGSGATIIGFFSDRASAQKAEQYFKSKGFWTLITKTEGV